MKCDILTLFPDMVEAVVGASIVGRARESGRVDVRAVNLREYAEGRHKVADDYGAITTPHVYLINKEGALVYEGSVDDQGWSEKNPVTKNYVRDAMDALLADKPVPTPQTKTFGCTVKRSK